MKIDRAEFIELIKQNISGFQADRVNMEDRLSDLGIDSLGFATLLFSLEDKFNTQIEDQHLSGLNGSSTVSELVKTFQGLGYQIEV